MARIEEELSTNYPSRKAIFKEAFNNYRQNNFYSSISLLITQIDGICYDNTKKLFFKNNPKYRNKGVFQPEFLSELEKSKIGILELVLSPLHESTLINEHTSNLRNYPIRLNRHEILHGIDTDFGTKINNLKIISMTKYICDILRNAE